MDIMDGYWKKCMYISINKYAPLQGCSYINLPKEICGSTKQRINIHPDENECLRWCIMRHPMSKIPSPKSQTELYNLPLNLLEKTVIVI